MIPLEAKSPAELAALPNPRGLNDPLLQGMIRDRDPLSLKTFLEMDYPDGVPDPLPQEVVNSIPRVLFDPRLKELDPSEPYYPELIQLIDAFLEHTVDELRHELDYV